VAGNFSGRYRCRIVRGRGLVSASRERGPSSDGRARRQRGVHIHAVRGRASRRLCRRRGRRPPAAAGYDGGRYRSPKLWPIHRHRQLVRQPGGNYEVITIRYCSVFIFFKYTFSTERTRVISSK